MKLTELQQYIKQKDFNPDAKDGYFQKLIEEVGELAKAIRNNARMGPDEQIKGTIEEELYDVLYYTVALANVYNIDLQRCFSLKEALNARKYGDKLR
jgi:NTP pyrophosphatase (non-canonical NTP hydrolase)